MSSSPPIAPRLLKCGIVLIDDSTGAVQRILALQYNPEMLTRSLQIRGVSGESGDHIEALRLKGPPVETLKIEAEMDAADQLEIRNPQAVQSGLHAQLAALETLIYPASDVLQGNHFEARSGMLEIAPAQMALTLFVLGPRRILPVRITELSITEEMFDVALNPIRAKVSLGLRVLTVDDLGFDSKGGGLFMAYLRAKEQLAQAARGSSFSLLGINGVS